SSKKPRHVSPPANACDTVPEARLSHLSLKFGKIGAVACDDKMNPIITLRKQPGGRQEKIQSFPGHHPKCRPDQTPSRIKIKLMHQGGIAQASRIDTIERAEKVKTIKVNPVVNEAQ